MHRAYEFISHLCGDLKDVAGIGFSDLSMHENYTLVYP